MVAAAGDARSTVGAGAFAGRDLVGRDARSSPSGDRHVQARTIIAVARQRARRSTAALDAPRAPARRWLIRERRRLQRAARCTTSRCACSTPTRPASSILPGSGSRPSRPRAATSATTYTIRLNRPGIGQTSRSRSAAAPPASSATGVRRRSRSPAAAAQRDDHGQRAADDAVREGFHFGYVGHALTSRDAFAGAVTAQSGRGSTRVVAQSFAADDLRGYIVRIVAGTGAGQWRYIRPNTRDARCSCRGLGRLPAGASDTYVDPGLHRAGRRSTEIAGTVAVGDAARRSRSTAALPARGSPARRRAADRRRRRRRHDACGRSPPTPRNTITIDVAVRTRSTPSGKQFVVVDLAGRRDRPLPVLVADADAPGVRIVETDGSTRARARPATTRHLHGRADQGADRRASAVDDPAEGRPRRCATRTTRPAAQRHPGHGRRRPVLVTAGRAIRNGDGSITLRLHAGRLGRRA